MPKPTEKKRSVLRNVIEFTLGITAGVVLFSLITGFVGLLLVSSNGIDPWDHHCSPGATRRIVLLEQRAKGRNKMDEKKPVVVRGGAYVTGSASFTTKSATRSRVGSISKPAVLFFVTLHPSTPLGTKQKVTATFTNPHFSKTITVVAASTDETRENVLESGDRWRTIWGFIKLGPVFFLVAVVITAIAVTSNGIQERWQSRRNKN